MTAAELKALRRSLGWSQQRLAGALGVPKNTLARWERGEIPIRHGEMLRLALERLAWSCGLGAVAGRIEGDDQPPDVLCDLGHDGVA